MVRFHLPFATVFETTYRAVSMYLTAQFMRQKKGSAACWDISKLTDIYQDISKVNMTFANRLRNLEMKDASLTAITNLDCFSFNIQFSDEAEIFNSLEPLFKPYFD